MDFNTYRTLYHRMPAAFRKHGDMPSTYEIYDDVDAYVQHCKSVLDISTRGVLMMHDIEN